MRKKGDRAWDTVSYSVPTESNSLYPTFSTSWLYSVPYLTLFPLTVSFYTLLEQVPYMWQATNIRVALFQLLAFGIGLTSPCYTRIPLASIGINISLGCIAVIELFHFFILFLFARFFVYIAAWFNLCHSPPALKMASQPGIVPTPFHPLTNALVFLNSIAALFEIVLDSFQRNQFVLACCPGKSWDLWDLGA